MIAAEQDPTQRTAWQTAVALLDPSHFIFLDETSTSTTLTPVRGWAPRGDRLLGRVPRQRWHTSTLLATLTTTGMGEAVVVEGATDRLVFDAFVEQFLVPKLRPGQIVIADNLGVHKSPHARQLIEAAGCELRFLPPYSPDCNPIEQAFSKLKQHLRQASPRTFDAIVAAVASALDAITPDDARGYFAAAGYPLP